MKKILILTIVALYSASLSAQTWSEWFNQQSTQKEYLLKQIAALQVYSGYVSKGNSIVKNGLNTIKSIRNGDLRQHTNYFNSLVDVNPRVKQYKKVAEIITLQISIAKQAGNALKSLKANRYFTLSEITYMQKVFSNLFIDCAKNLNDLYVLITDGNLQLKDDERIKAIDRIFTDMQDKQQFVRSFCNSATGLAVQRSNEANDIIISKTLNDLKWKSV